jgi:hypothetical protein
MNLKKYKMYSINTNDKNLRDGIKKAINQLRVEKKYNNRQELLTKEILTWFDTFNKDLKKYNVLNYKEPIYAYGLQVEKELYNELTAKYGRGKVVKIILNWYFETQIKG